MIPHLRKDEWDLSYEWMRLQLWMNKTSAKDEWDYSYEWMRLQLWINEITAMNECSTQAINETEECICMKRIVEDYITTLLQFTE